MPAYTVPPPLDAGDRVAVVQPAAVADGAAYPDHLLEVGLERLREGFDLEPVVYESVERSGEFLYENPGFRARELERAFRNPEIRGVVAVLGGNDQIRVLPHLDPEPIRSNPTRFFGSSDNTAFAAFCREHGVVTFYGGDLYVDVAEPGGINDYTREYLRRAFFDDALGNLREAARFSDHQPDWRDPANLRRELEYEAGDGRGWHVADGGPTRVDGRTWGGCLEVLTSQFVSDVALPTDPAGSVLLLETSEELPAADVVRRALHGIGQRGSLDVDAVLVGRATARSHREPRDPDAREAYRERQREAVVDTVRRYSDAVVVTDCEFGHARPIAPVPVGGRAVVDADAETIRFP